MPDVGPKLHHEDLDAYEVAIEFLAFGAELIAQYPRGLSGMLPALPESCLAMIALSFTAWSVTFNITDFGRNVLTMGLKLRNIAFVPGLEREMAN
ncbi:MAG: hypothetical protein HYV07_29285 [Deltaproteobacteria bacterium]|nr:hypothetical protein [Deltaproteobacteria bacterium]